jgi:hypothetical protein
MSYNELITSLSNKSNKILNLKFELNICLKNSEEFGCRMEETYNEPMEYTTSKCESLHSSLREILNIISKYDTTHIDTLILSNKFNIYLNERKNCDALQLLYKQIVNSFDVVDTKFI